MRFDAIRLKKFIDIDSHRIALDRISLDAIRCHSTLIDIDELVYRIELQFNGIDELF